MCKGVHRQRGPNEETERATVTICGARITIQTSQRKKNGVVYRYGRYRCSFHVTKGPAVQGVLDARLLDKFKGAMTPFPNNDSSRTSVGCMGGRIRAAASGPTARHR